MQSLQISNSSKEQTKYHESIFSFIHEKEKKRKKEDEKGLIKKNEINKVLLKEDSYPVNTHFVNASTTCKVCRKSRITRCDRQ